MPRKQQACCVLPQGSDPDAKAGQHCRGAVYPAAEVGSSASYSGYRGTDAWVPKAIPSNIWATDDQIGSKRLIKTVSNSSSWTAWRPVQPSPKGPAFHCECTPSTPWVLECSRPRPALVQYLEKPLTQTVTSNGCEWKRGQKREMTIWRGRGFWENLPGLW